MLTCRLSLVLISACLLTLLGCRDEKISSYRVRKEAPPKLPTPAAPDSGVPQLHWTTPTGWKEEPAGNVRVASFTVTSSEGQKADMSVTQFPGDVGGDLANVNRWRGQLQLPPITEADMSRYVKPMDFPAGNFLVTEFVAEKSADTKAPPKSILGAWLKQPERTWFFKLAGDEPLVTAQREAFLNFLKSLSFSAAAASSEDAMAAPASADMSNVAGPASARSVTWNAPSDWTPKPLGAMRKGSFSLRGLDGSEADLSIISFPGEAGGLADNLNRWRRQLQLDPQSPADLASASSTIANDGLRFTVVDYTGKTENGATRLVGAILPLETETYFFKLMGPDAVVAQHKAAFLDFLKTVKVR